MATVKTGKLFTCGNHFIETTRGMLHFGDPPSQVVCMLQVPSTMTARDVIQFLNPSMQEIENTRIIREVGSETSYTVLLTFRNSEAARDFYLNYDGVQFNSLEEHKCKLLYVTRKETFVEDPAKIEEGSNCAVCLDRMHIEVESIITILCNHSFHAHCLSKWTDTSCPVCRYCQTPENQAESKCMDCDYEGDSLWMCIICGYMACGRYINGHAYDHFSQTQHTYAMGLTDNQVWDYAGDNYVHRLLANKTDGKPVEVEGADAYRQAEEKIEAVQLEYTYLLTQQLESQRKYYEKLITDSEKQNQKKLKDAKACQKKTSDDLTEMTEKYQMAVKDTSDITRKYNSMKSKLAKVQAEIVEERSISNSLRLNQEQFQQKIKDMQSKLDEKDVKLNERAAEIAELKEQYRDLAFYLEARAKIETSVNDKHISREELDDSQVVMPASTSSKSSSTSNNKNNRRRKK